MANRLTYLTELTELFTEPKTLRKMKGTCWAKIINNSISSGSNILKIKANDMNELTAVVREWNEWIEAGEQNRIWKNEKGNILFCDKNDLFAYENDKTTERMKRATQEQLLEHNRAINSVEHSEKTYKIMANCYSGKKRVVEMSEDSNVVDKSVIEKIIENNRVLFEEKEQKYKKAIEDYDRINAKLAKELDYEFLPYLNSFDVERINNNHEYDKDNRTIYGSETLQTLINRATKVVKIKEGEAVCNRLLWEKWDDNRNKYYSDTPDKCPCVFRNGFCYLSLKTAVIRQEIYLKKGVKLHIKPSHDTLFTPEMFKVTKKRMKCWNTQNVKERLIFDKRIQGAFIPYEECGVEVFYVRLGYSSDKKKLPNHNRGTLECLKWALKENEYKKKKGDKVPTKKDDIIKILLKL